VSLQQFLLSLADPSFHPNSELRSQAIT